MTSGFGERIICGRFTDEHFFSLLRLVWFLFYETIYIAACVKWIYEDRVMFATYLISEIGLAFFFISLVYTHCLDFNYGNARHYSLLLIDEKSRYRYAVGLNHWIFILTMYTGYRVQSYLI
jgi:hypothetical protein